MFPPFVVLNLVYLRVVYLALTYTLFTRHMPIAINLIVASYADNRAILSSNKSLFESSVGIQRQWNIIEKWLKN